METNRNIWNPSRSLLGLILLAGSWVFPLNAKEIFDVPFKCCSAGFGFSTVKTVSFYFIGNESINIDNIVKSIGEGKANVVITGENGVEGKALSSNMFIDVVLRKNTEENAYLVMIDAYVPGSAKDALGNDESSFTGKISIVSDILVFVGSTHIQEIEKAISHHLVNITNRITSSAESKPTFFIVH